MKTTKRDNRWTLAETVAAHGDKVMEPSNGYCIVETQRHPPSVDYWHTKDHIAVATVDKTVALLPSTRGGRRWNRAQLDAARRLAKRNKRALLRASRWLMAHAKDVLHTRLLPRNEVA